MISNTQISTQLVELTGAASAYFHRLLNDIIDTLNGVSGNAGVATVSPNGSGQAVISHGFSVRGHPVVLARCTVFPVGTTAFVVQPVSVDETGLTVKLFDMAGAAITTGSYSVSWRVGG